MKASFFLKNLNSFFAFLIVLLSFLSFKANDKTIVVSKDGKGNFSTIQQAVNAAENGSSVRTKIIVKEGIYKEKIIIPETKGAILLEGENPEKIGRGKAGAGTGRSGYPAGPRAAGR